MAALTNSARLMLVGVSLAWGLTWPALKLALDEIPPFSMRVGTCALAACALFTLGTVQGRELRVRSPVVGAHLVVAGCLNVAAFAVISAFAQLATTTSRVAVVTYSMPIWAALFARLVLREQLDIIRALSLLACAAGLTVLAYPLLGSKDVTGLGLALVTAVSWAAGTVYLKWARIEADPLAISAWQMVVGLVATSVGLLLMEGGLHLWPVHMPALLGLLFAGLVGSAVAYSLWFEVVRRLPAMTASLGVLNAPVLGVLASMAVLGERPTLADVIGFALILLAAACVLLAPAKRSSEASEIEPRESRAAARRGSPRSAADEHRPAGLLRKLALLWLVGTTLRITIGAVPPVIPNIHDALGMSETQVGLLIGVPLLTWALIATPGSLLISRLGARRTLLIGLIATALAGAARAAVPDVWLLYAATLIMGAGIAIMQPALPTLVRDWLPQRIGLATAVTSNGILIGVSAGPVLSIPVVLPLVAESWRLDLLIWAAPVLVTAVLLFAFAPLPSHAGSSRALSGARWWPDWKNPLIWLLGLSFGSNNALFFGANAFLPDYLVSIGRSDLTAAGLGLLSGSQLLASFLLFATAERWQRQAWPYLVFGAGTLAGIVGIATATGVWIVAAAALLGFSLAVTFVLMLALPALRSPPGEVHRVSAGMFTISYSCAVVIPTACGAAWDLTGRPWAAFIPLGLCGLALTVLGFALAVHRPSPAPGRVGEVTESSADRRRSPP